MKLNKNIKYVSGALMLAAGLSMSSCNFLDIVPPEQADMDDAIANADATEGFLYSCYKNVKSPIYYGSPEGSADEYALPQIWNETPHKFAYDLLSVDNSIQVWNYNYKYIGQTYLFLENLPNAKGITEEQRTVWEAEAQFLLAYYHFQILRMYGPCPIVEKRIPLDTPAGQYSGRWHYDAATQWIVDKLDNLIDNNKLAFEQTTNTRGRATHAIACALKARVLLYAASPLWNGSFPYKDWRNKVTTSYNGVDYGYELVSQDYDVKKWEKARDAYIVAIREAQAAGYRLYGTSEDDLNDYETKNVPLANVMVPGEGIDDEFKKRVLMLRHMLTLRENEGNKEFIWGVSDDDSTPTCMMPFNVVQKYDGNWVEGYNSYSPYLNAVERFYTKDGNFLDTTDPALLQRANVDNTSPDLTNLCVGREPRFYAWIAYDQGYWGTMIAEGKPLKVEFKDANKQGFNANSHYRNHNVTGFLAQKFVRPDRRFDRNGNVNNERFQRPLIRMAELYLGLAECYAALGQTTEALENLNKVHERAGLPAIEESDIIGGHPLMSWIQNERFVELFGEGHRYYDVRRWMIAPKVLAAGCREGLNAELSNPTFDQFNTRVKVPQPFKWSGRMYLCPVLTSEIGKNTNLVQAPGY